MVQEDWGKDRSERFLNNLYKVGNVVINKQTGKISVKVAEKLYRSASAPNFDIADLNSIKLEKEKYLGDILLWILYLLKLLEDHYLHL